MKAVLILFFSITMAFANHGRPNFYDWCNDVTRNLQQAKADSMMAYQHGDYRTALNRVKSEFQRLYNGDMAAYNHSITLQLLRRGLELSTILERHLMSDPRNLRLTNLFMHKYADFVINAAENLDIPYYSYDCRYCQKDIEDLEKTFAGIAFDQVAMVVDNFALPTGQLVYPLGSSDLLLKTLEVTAHSSAQDLQNSFFAEFYSCQIRSLYNLNHELANYNSSTTRPPYMNDRNMVQRAYWMAKEVVDGTGPHCNRMPVQNHTETIARNITVRKSNGDYVLNLKYPRRIKRLIIWSEGIRRDAKYDVVVNGIEKGTIYVPGRDPKYFVTVHATTSQIIFRPDFGNAKINRIDVEI